MTGSDDITVRFAADTRAMREDIERVGEVATRVGEQLGQSLSGAFEDAVIRGESLSEVLRSLALDLSRVALNAALSPLEDAAGRALGGVLGGLFGAADGAVVAGGRVSGFARGGVVSAPTAFPLAGGVGVMGEAGPEAILPLSRGRDGRLGVATEGTAARPISVTINVSTPDAASFRRSETQIAGAVSRALARAGRSQ